jgi:predicted chitinase
MLLKCYNVGLKQAPSPFLLKNKEYITKNEKKRRKSKFLTFDIELKIWRIIHVLANAIYTTDLNNEFDARSGCRNWKFRNIKGFYICHSKVLLNPS